LDGPGLVVSFRSTGGDRFSKKLFDPCREDRSQKGPLEAERAPCLIRWTNEADGRAALDAGRRPEVCARRARRRDLNAEALQDILQRRAPIYDKSATALQPDPALHKSVRGSESDAACIISRGDGCGEDPLFWRGALFAWRSRGKWARRSARRW